MPQDPSFFDQLSKGIADAVTDIREKVVEEPMYGRTLSDRDSAPQWPEAKEPEPTGPQDKAEHSREQEKAPEPDRDIDR